MGRVNLSLCFLSFMLFLVVCSGSQGLLHAVSNKAWCIAQVRAPVAKMQDAKRIYCAKVDCRAIMPGGSCYTPNTLYNHASYALDAHYRVSNDCPFDVVTPAFNDPSFGKCHYP